MSEQIERILWCPDCMTKHARDLMHHAEARGNNELKRLAEKAFNVASGMLGVKNKKDYKDIRDLEHHTEDLLTGLRTERKKLTASCPTCNPAHSLPSAERITYIKGMETKHKTGINMVRGEEVIKTIAGNTLGKVVETYLPSIVPAGAIIPGISNATLANLAYGLAIDLVAITKPGLIPSKLELPLIASANFVIADVVGDLVLGMVAPTAPVTAAAANAVALAGVRTNGSLIYID